MLEVTEAQVAAFRARRGHLAGPGAASAAHAARAVVGIQAQVEGPALWALSMRAAPRPTAAALWDQILEQRRLVRIWAQRDTLHLYAADDWAVVAGADPMWPMSGRRGASPPDHALEQTRRRLAEGPVTRSDLYDYVTDEMYADMASRVGDEQAPRYAAGRLVWRLSHLGEVCLGPKAGSEQSYVSRASWLPDLPFAPPPPEDAAQELVRRYLAANGPATAKDVAHYFGAKVTVVRRWLEALAPELVSVRCGSRDGLVLRADDAEAVRTAGPAPAARLVAGYDTLLMAHVDKSWTTPVEQERPRVWKRSAIVSAVVLAGGRIVATWSHKKRSKRVDVTVVPLSGWSTDHSGAVEADAERLAAHLEVAEASVTLA